MFTESKTFAADIDAVPEMMEYVAGLVEGFPAKTAYDITLACEEILVNITSYAYPQSDGQLVILYENDTENHKLKLSFEDFGIPFNPLRCEEPDLSVPMAERKIGGLGIMMIRKLMDTVQYDHKDHKNILTFTKSY